MKGVILAGGLGMRLDPLTRVTNKHLLPVYNKPMIHYPIRTLVDAGVRDILIVTGGNHAGDFLRLLGNGAEFGLNHINYTYQRGQGGIADALGLAEHFAGGDKTNMDGEPDASARYLSISSIKPEPSSFEMTSFKGT